MTTSDVSGEDVRWPVGLQGDVEDAVVDWLAKDDLANADRSLFDCIVAALGLRPANPYGKNGHGLGCWFRKGGPCDCTASETRYFVIERPSQSGRNA